MEPVENLRIARSSTERIWAAAKYDVMARGYQHYKSLSKQAGRLHGLSDVHTFFHSLRIVSGRPYDRRGCINTLEHMWGYVKKDAGSEEKETFQHLLSEAGKLPYSHFYEWRGAMEQTRLLLCRLSKKYAKDYLLESIILFPDTPYYILHNRKGTFMLSDDMLWKIN
ncbi:DUF1722 domain-containing protein [Salibacterium halotolerans]|uniref:DUF1722 domain-containing protein n=1 Tax=Salibacterium halotolerans TaxID=1884432 RepID=A0A1I5X6K9_9BACI|nr:DUF1722 domain-containing protein [Salibacterium halotolerans]SFQ27590.1 Protein of unknown function [Salibacterium halotolerans]